MNRDGYHKKSGAMPMACMADGGEVDEAAQVKGEVFESDNDKANGEGRFDSDTYARARAFLARGGDDGDKADAPAPKKAASRAKPVAKAAAKPAAKAADADADAPAVKSAAETARKPGIYESPAKWNSYRNEATGNQSAAESNRLASHKRVDIPRGESKEDFAANRGNFDSKTLLPKRYADGGQIGGRTYGKKG